MKILVTGDFHLDRVTAGVARIGEVEAAWGQLTEAAAARHADLVVFLGDLCNPDKGSRTLRSVSAGIRMFKGLVSRAGCAVVAIAGNHDVVADDSGLTSLSPIREAFQCADVQAPRKGESQGQTKLPYFVATPGVVAVAESPMLLLVEGDGECIDVLCLPYVAHARQYDPEVAASLAKSMRHLAARPLVVAAHLELEGAQLGSETTDMPRGRTTSFPAKALENGKVSAFNGHYHKRQRVGGVECPGSLARLAFDEEGNAPRWLEVDL